MASKGWMGALGLVVFVAACEGGPTDDSRALVVTARPAPEPQPTDTTAVDDSHDGGSATTTTTTTDDGYAAMCRFYCATLEETDVYACIARGSEASGCSATYTGLRDECWDIRCAPHLVPWSLCSEQCDSLATFYGMVCAGVTPADGTLCPSSPADHDAACRAGCPPPPAP
jgi:hypothetical protein